jgi:hypothetical protein
MIDLPTLDDTYVQWQIKQAKLAFNPSLEVAQRAFLEMSSRPEILREALDRLDETMGVTAANVDEIFSGNVRDILQESKKVFFRFMNSLTPLQAAVIKTMALKGENYAPYIQESYDLCRKFCSEQTKEAVNIDSSSVAYALEALREKKLIWKSGRGVYMIEETQTSRWLNEVMEVSNAATDIAIDRNSIPRDK